MREESKNTFSHVPVLLNEVLDGLNIREDGIYVDGTLGGAGHSGEILKKLEKGVLIGIDQDGDAIKAAAAHLNEYGAELERAGSAKDSFTDNVADAEAFTFTITLVLTSLAKHKDCMKTQTQKKSFSRVDLKRLTI